MMPEETEIPTAMESWRIRSQSASTANVLVTVRTCLGNILRRGPSDDRQEASVRHLQECLCRMLDELHPRRGRRRVWTPLRRKVLQTSSVSADTHLENMHDLQDAQRCLHQIEPQSESQAEQLLAMVDELADLILHAYGYYRHTREQEKKRFEDALAELAEQAKRRHLVAFQGQASALAILLRRTKIEALLLAARTHLQLAWLHAPIEYTGEIAMILQRIRAITEEWGKNEKS